MFKDKLCLVTGGAGFIGHHLVNRLVKEGARVRVLDNMDTGRVENNNPKAEFWKSDITDYRSVMHALASVDIIFHTAAIARIQPTIESPLKAHKVNATGTLTVLEASRRSEVKRFVYSSTYSLYAPTTPYYVSKMAAEEYVRIYNDLYKLSTVSLRYSTVYGSGQSPEGQSPNLMASMYQSKKKTGRIWVSGDGEQTRDFVHVSDVIEANILAAQSNYCGYVDICTGIETSLNDCAKHFNCPVDYVGEAKGDVRRLWGNPEKAEKELGWKPKVLFIDGMKELMAEWS